MKYCPKCDQTKEITAFYCLRTAADGVDSWCKLCRRNYQKRYREYKKAYASRYRKEHPNKQQEWIENNREHLREYYHKRYYKDRQRYLRQSRIRKAKMKSISGSHTQNQWEDLLHAYNYKCFACTAEHVELTQDHLVPISKGGTDNIENIVPLCRSCNSKKGTNGAEWFMKVWLTAIRAQQKRNTQ